MRGTVHRSETCDHKLPKAMGGGDEDGNLWGVCGWFHRRKTGIERAMLRAGEQSTDAEAHVAMIVQRVYGTGGA